MVQESIAASVNRIGALESAISTLQANSDNLTGRIAMLQKASTAEETIAELRQRNASLEAANAALNDRVAANMRTIENLAQQIMQLSDRVEMLENQ